MVGVGDWLTIEAVFIGALIAVVKFFMLDLFTAASGFSPAQSLFATLCHRTQWRVLLTLLLVVVVVMVVGWLLGSFVRSGLFVCLFLFCFCCCVFGWLVSLLAVCLFVCLFVCLSLRMSEVGKGGK